MATFVDFCKRSYELLAVDHQSMGCSEALIQGKIPANMQETPAADKGRRIMDRYEARDF
jgi:hypothetical protein